MTENRSDTKQRYTLIKEDPPFGLAHTGFKFEQKGRKEIKQFRREFRDVHPKFIKMLAEKQPKRLASIGIQPEEIAQMREDGVAPVGFVVRHITPMAARGSTNSFSNLILIPQQPYNSAIDEYLAKQLKGMRTDKAGRSRQIKLPLLRTPIFPVPRKSVAAITTARFQLAEEREEEAEKRLKIREEKKLEREQREEQRRLEKQAREDAEHEAEMAERAAWPPKGYTVQDIRRLAAQMDIDPDEAVKPISIPGNHSVEDSIDAEWNRDLIRQAMAFEDHFEIVGRKKRNKGNRKNPNKGKGKGHNTASAPKPKQRVILPSGPGNVDTYDMPIAEIEYTRRIKTYREIDGEKVDVLRYQGLLAKQRFLKMLADEHGEELRRVFKLEQCEIDGMREGFTPQGLSVHHKHPLGGAGDPTFAARANDFDNLTLIQMEPYHTAIHKYLDPQIQHLKPGETRKVKVPWPEGYWYEPPTPHVRSGPPKCDDEPKNGQNASGNDNPSPRSGPGWQRSA